MGCSSPMESLRCIVAVSPALEVTVTRADTKELLGPPRTLQRVEHERYGAFPLPPASEPAPALATAETIGEAYRAIIDRRGDQVEVFGEYLFQTLLGPAIWAKIEQIGAPVVELALQWRGDQLELHRLHWEMMRGPDGFLAAGARFPTAITRVVAGTGELRPRTLRAPPRVLFVVGAAVNDPAIRPGAELMGVLRRVRASGRSIHSYVLERASPDRVRTAVRNFEPDVVHFIAHGGIDAQGR